MKAVIYTRVSSEEQVSGTSLDFQEEQCRIYCKNKGIEVLEVFREEGASAKTAVRAEFLRAIEFCRKNRGSVNYFVVAKVDRFARNTEDHFAVRKMLLDFGVQLHSVSEPIGGNSPIEKLFETLLAGFADFDNAIRRQRCMDGMSERINQGIYPWMPPLGYLPTNTSRQGLKKTEPDPPDEILFPIIQRALVEFSKGKTSKMELVRLMDSWGFSTKRGGKRTHVQIIDKMLSEKRLKFYSGIIENPWTGLDVKGKHIPMIDEMTRQRILYVLSGKRVNKPKLVHNNNYPLRGTILCDSCNRALTGSTSRGNGGQYYYYHCKNSACSQYGKSLRKHDLEEQFVECLRKIKPTNKFLKVFEASVIDLWREQGESLNEAANSYQKQLVALQSRRKRICDLRESGEYSASEFAERKGFVDSQIAAMKIAMSETRIDQFDVEAAVSYATQFIADLHQQWKDLPPAVRPRFQKLVFPEKITVAQLSDVGTVKLGCIFELNRENQTYSSMVVDPRGVEPRTHPCHGCVLPLYHGPNSKQIVAYN